MDLAVLLKLMVEKDASDIFLKAGDVPRMRIMGKIVPEGGTVLTVDNMEAIVKSILNDSQRAGLKEKLEIDFAFDAKGIGRFRTNILYQQSSLEIVCRRVKSEIPSFEALGLPAAVLKKLSLESRGLVLLCGATGSGKSTTIASMIEYINQERQKHILTIEDPIEFVFEDKKSLVTQREIGLDTLSYEAALKHSMLQSPDVIFIGNIRDRETMSAALSAAETGQLVLSTVHSINTVEAVERIIGFYPPHHYDEIRMQLSLLLKGIVSLRLIKSAAGDGRIPAYEVMLGTTTIKGLIREGNVHQIRGYVEEGTSDGMITFDQCLVELCKNGKISVEDAKENADSIHTVELGLSGLKRIHEKDINDTYGT